MNTDNRTGQTDFEVDALVARIEKMWRRANHPNTPPAEREVAQAKALSLMAQHRIEMEMLDLDQTDELGDHFLQETKGSYGLLINNLINSVAVAYDCRVWWRNYGMNYKVYLTGYESDVRRVRALVSFLLVDAMAQASQFKSRSIAQTKDYKRSFLTGYSIEIANRLRESTKFAREAAVAKAAADDVLYSNGQAAERAEARVHGAELVLAEKSKRVNDFMKTKKLRAVGHSSGRSSNGRADGAIAARNADLSGGRNRLGSGTKALGR